MGVGAWVAHMTWGSKRKELPGPSSGVTPPADQPEPRHIAWQTRTPTTGTFLASNDCTLPQCAKMHTSSSQDGEILPAPRPPYHCCPIFALAITPRGLFRRRRPSIVITREVRLDENYDVLLVSLYVKPNVPNRCADAQSPFTHEPKLSPRML
jgi:hypothetical protein